MIVPSVLFIIIQCYINIPSNYCKITQLYTAKCVVYYGIYNDLFSKINNYHFNNKVVIVKLVRVLLAELSTLARLVGVF